MIKRNFAIMLKHTDIITAIQNGQNKFLFIGNEACCLEELIQSVIMELNPQPRREHMNILQIFRDRLGQNTSEFKELIKNRLQKRRGSGNRNCLAMFGVNSLNMNLQNWLQETLRIVNFPILCIADNVHEVHPNILSHFYVIKAPRVQSPLNKKLQNIPGDLSGNFWENYVKPEPLGIENFGTLEELQEYCFRHNINPHTQLDDTKNNDINVPLNYVNSKMLYLPQLSPITMIL